MKRASPCRTRIPATNPAGTDFLHISCNGPGCAPNTTYGGRVQGSLFDVSGEGAFFRYTFNTGYAEMAIQSWQLFDRLQQDGVIPAGVKFQISLPTPIAPTYNNMVPTDRPALIPVLTTHMLGEVTAIAQALPNDRIALQWDVCQEVIAWEGYYEPGPVDFRKETIAELIAIGDGVPADGQRWGTRVRPTGKEPIFRLGAGG